MTTETRACRHHWIIEPPTLPESQGACVSCGEQRVFRNSWTVESRQEDPLPAGPRSDLLAAGRSVRADRPHRARIALADEL